MKINDKQGQIKIIQDLIKTYQQYNADPAIIQQALHRLNELQGKDKK